MNSDPKNKSDTSATHVPDQVRQALDILASYSGNLDNLDDEVKQALARINHRYRELINKFSNISQYRPQHRQESDERIEILKHLPLFESLSGFDLIMISEQMEESHPPAGTDLTRQGEVPDGVYFIGDGKVQILVNDELVAHRGTGDCVGEMSCLRNEVASATVRTVNDCKVFRIQREPFMQTVNRFPQLWRKLFSELTDRFEEINNRASEILQHSPQGLMKVAPDQTITNEFSTQCMVLLGITDLQGINFAELLFGFSQEALSGFQQLFPLLFQEVQIGFQEVAALFPSEVEYQHPAGGNRYFKLSYYPCSSKQGDLVAIDIGLEDITEEKEFAKRTEELEAEKVTMHKIYDDPESYLHLLAMASDTLALLLRTHQAFAEVLNEQKEASPAQDSYEWEHLPELMRNLHTLKGVSGIFALNDFKQVMHQIEDYLKWIQTHRKVTPYHLKQIQVRAEAFEQQNEYCQSLINNLSEELRLRLTGVVLPPQSFLKLKQAVERGHWEETRNLIQQVERVSARKLVHDWGEEIDKLANRLRKLIKFRIQGDNFQITREHFEALKAPMIHLMRNSLDHGLESPEQREHLGKPEWGYISVNYRLLKDCYVIEITDDGKGLDYARILEKARATPDLNSSEVEAIIESGEIWKLLFLPGFSTASEISDLSGRGVGLDAVRQAVESISGTIDVRTQHNQGTTFAITIPATQG